MYLQNYIKGRNLRLVHIATHSNIYVWQSPATGGRPLAAGSLRLLSHGEPYGEARERTLLSEIYIQRLQ